MHFLNLPVYLQHDIRLFEVVFIVMNGILSFFVFIAVVLMFAFQTYYVMHNTTNIEILEIERANKAFQKGDITAEEAHFPFDMGRLDNLKAVLGGNIILWMFPQKIKGNGIEYPLNVESAGYISTNE